MERRPDPKELLKYVQKEERQQKQGKLKVFLGAAPGVGKTYTMLEEAIGKQKEGVDVIAGVVETHGRQETQVFLEKIELLPLKTILYRDKTFSEFDLDAALLRHPQLILVDELAHTNVPGSRHNKRWQDIIELLDRGIDVYTTVNVQHIESLNNIITQITGVIVRETVPDTILEKANSIELIDLPPDDLIRRLEEGKIYLPSEVSVAIDHFFRKGNLSALRELALRITADQVDAEVLLYRQGESIEKILPVGERLLVCIGPSSNASKLIRATRRMATSLHAKWIAISIETPEILRSESKKQAISDHFKLAEQLGGETLLVGGTDIGTEIIKFAQDRNITKIIIGKKIRSRWQAFWRRSLADELVHRIDIDLYILRSGDLETLKANKNLLKKIPTPKLIYFISILTILFCGIINYFLLPIIELNAVMMVYFFGVAFVASLGYFGPAFLSAFLSVFSFQFFQTNETSGFLSIDTKGIINLSVMFLVSIIVSYITVVVKQQAESSRSRERRVAAMHFLSKELARTRGISKLLAVSMQHISEVFNVDVIALLPNGQNKLIPMVGYPVQVPLDSKAQSVAEWVYELGQMAGLGTDTLPDNDSLYIPLLGTRGPVGVLRILPKEPQQFSVPEQLHFLAAFSNQIAMALEVDRFEEEAKKAEVERKMDDVRNVVMKYISDIMYAPLVDIIDSAEHLIHLGQKTQSEAIESLGRNIYSSSEEMNHLISNLSQIARLENTELTFTKEPHSLRNVIEAALKSLSRRLLNRPIFIEIPDIFPKLLFNKVFLEHVFFNIIENAIKYTPPTAPIEISGILEEGRAVISIRDEGPGLALQEIQQIFIKFYRGQTNIKGMGLGLTICKKIINMHGGEIWAENRPEGGAVFRFTLPR